MRKKRNKEKTQIQEIGREKETEQRRSLAPGRAFQSVQSSVSSPSSVHPPGIILYTGSPRVATHLHGRRSRGAQRKESCSASNRFLIQGRCHHYSFSLFLFIPYFIFFFLSYLLTNWTAFDFLFFLFYSLFSEKDRTFLRFSN